MAEATGLPTDSRHEIWKTTSGKKGEHGDFLYHAHDSIQVYLRRVGDVQYLVLMPSIRVFDVNGTEAPREIAKPVKQGILGWQHNDKFNDAVNAWRDLLFPKGQITSFEFPRNCGSTFKFKMNRNPVFGEIGLPEGGRRTMLSDKVRSVIKYRGIHIAEPELLFSNKEGTGLISSPHPIRGIAENYPYDYALTARGFLGGLRLGIICPANEARNLRRYLHNIERVHQPTRNERDYLVDYTGFQSAYGVSMQIPEVGQSGWFICPDPSSSDPQIAARELAGHINRGIESLHSSYAPHVVLIFYPERWAGFHGYRTESESFDVHDFVKAFCVQRGIASQFLTEDTLLDQYQCRVWWWLSLALYVKGMRTPWVLKSLAEDAAFVGLGFSVDPA